jgi:hypothetical protein
MCAEVKLLLQFTYMEIIYQVLSFLPAVISEPYRMNYRVSQKKRKLLKSLIVKIECTIVTNLNPPVWVSANILHIQKQFKYIFL